MAGPPALREVVIVASSACNQRCSYCWISPREPVSPPWRAVAPALERLLASPERRVRVSFTGGEPLLAFPLIRTTVAYVEASRRSEQRVRYRLLTNGLLLDPAAQRFLAKNGFDTQISLDGGRDAQERRSFGSSERLDDLFAGLRRRLPRYLEEHVSIAATVTPETVSCLADSVSHLMSTGAGTVGVAAAMGAGPARCSDVAELDRQLGLVSRDVLSRFRRTNRVLFGPFRKGLHPGRARRPGPWLCAAPLNRTLAVDADGTSASCVMATRTYAPAPPRELRAAVDALRRLPAGGSMDEAALRLFRRASGRYSCYGPCARCRWQPECRVCPLAAVAERRWADARRVPSFLCAFNRVLLDHRDRFPPQPPGGAAG